MKTQLFSTRNTPIVTALTTQGRLPVTEVITGNAKDVVDFAVKCRTPSGDLLDALPNGPFYDAEDWEYQRIELTPVNEWQQETGYRVIVSVTLAEGCSVADAEIDEASLGQHEYEVKAYSADIATEKALDLYHDHHAIGVLDYVNIDTLATPLP